MKIHCYFLLNIKHGASQLYWGRPPNTAMSPPGEGGGMGRDKGLRPQGGGGLQLPSARNCDLDISGFGDVIGHATIRFVMPFPIGGLLEPSLYL